MRIGKVKGKCFSSESCTRTSNTSQAGTTTFHRTPVSWKNREGLRELGMYEIPGKLLGHRAKQGVTDSGHLSVCHPSAAREGVDYVEW